MEKVNILGKKHIFFVGIGGISMSGLAKLMVKNGIKVSGSDMQNTHVTQNLENDGVKVYYNHSETNITNDIDLLVFSGAIKQTNVEIITAKKLEIECLERSEFLGLVCEMFENVIAISGTHGKTTTTALLGEILIEANLNPTIHLGGEVSKSYNNFRIGDNKFFVTEACEYKKSLTYIKNNHAIITNIEKDHMDCYANLDEIYKTFNIFLKNCSNFLVVLNNNSTSKLKHKNIILCDDEKEKLINLRNIKKSKVFSLKEILNKQNQKCKYVIKSLKFNKHQNFSYKLYENVGKKKKLISKFSVSLQGKYNVYNSYLAIVMAIELGVSVKDIKKALEKFPGIKRRNEFMGTIQINEKNERQQINEILKVNEIKKKQKKTKPKKPKQKKSRNIPVFSDYAHHPTEIEKSITNYRKIHKNILVVFQPHTYSRTIALKEEFKNCFNKANNLIVFKTYPAREEFNAKGSETKLYELIKHVENKHLVLEETNLKREILKVCKENKKIKAIVFLGAGNLHDSITNILEIK